MKDKSIDSKVGNDIEIIEEIKDKAVTTEAADPRADEVARFYAVRPTTFRGVFYAQGYTISIRRGDMNNSNFIEVTDDELKKLRTANNTVADPTDIFVNKRNKDILDRAKGAIL